MVELKERHGAWLFLDEAHAVGVIGQQGRGLADEEGITGRVEVQMGTLGKALGVSGGYIAGSRVLIDFLINRARSFIFSTASSPAVAAACRASLHIVTSTEGDDLRTRLRANLLAFSSDMGISPPASAIVPLILGSEDRAVAASGRLLEEGFLVPAIRYPTVPRKTARLRVTLSAAHEADQIRALVQALGRLEERDSQG
jgi:7-keto-8-aminopelargonate synthetase-like enzyme